MSYLTHVSTIKMIEDDKTPYKVVPHSTVTESVGCSSRICSNITLHTGKLAVS